MVSGLGLSCSDTSVAVETAAAPVVVIPAGPLPAANGEPLTAVSTPLVPSIANATTEPGLLSVTYTNRPEASTAKCCAFGPALNGDPVIPVSPPLTWSIPYPYTVPDELAAYKNLPVGSTATLSLEKQQALVNGDPFIA